MSNIVAANFSLSKYVTGAQEAVLANPTQVTIWAMAEYLDLVEAKELKANTALVRECKAAISRFVMQNLANDAYVPFWERAGCLFRAYKRALKAAERALNEQMEGAALTA
jgi:hypothetical protein